MKCEVERLGRLSGRELEVLELMKKGLSNAEIGEALGISRYTAKAHVAAVIRKLEVSNRTEAVGVVQAREDAHGCSAEAPAVAVLPLFVDTHERLERSFADAFMDDLITHLGRRWFPVIARSSSFRLPPETLADTERVGETLDAQYVVEGALHLVRDRVRLNIRLVDARPRHVIWSDSLTTDMQGLLDTQDEFTSAIAAAISARAIETSAQDAPHAEAPRLAPWQLAARGMTAFWQGSRQHHGQAQALFRDALARDDSLRLGHYGLALTHQREVIEQWTKSVDQACTDLSRTTDRFNRRHPNDPWASLMSAYVATYMGRRQEAIDHVTYTLSQEPSSVRARSLHGQLLAMAGKVKPALAEIEKAIRLSPRAPDRWSQECVMGLAHFAGKDYEAAVRWANRSVATRDVSAMPHSLLASSHAHLGHMREACEALATLKARQHSYTERRFGPAIACTDPEISERYLAGLQKAASA